MKPKKPPLTEREFQRQVVDLAKLCGFRVAHFRPGRTRDGGWRTPVEADGAGFPDLTLCHPGRRLLLFVEVKVRTKLSAAQAGWLADLRAAGVRAEVWVPEMWSETERTLRGGAG